MKRELILLSMLFIFLALFLSNISNVSAELTDNNISKAYNCLQNKTTNCSTSLDDNIFTLLTLGTCKDKVMQKATNDECWPAGNCNVKQTSQAILALKESGADTTKPINWLLLHNKTATGIEWFLQIESSEKTNCKAIYGEPGKEATYSFSIDANKKLSSSAGSCLSLAEGDYWFKISSAGKCPTYKYSIKCDEDFKTSTLFKKTTSPTVYVWRQVNGASKDGTTTEEIKSLCFADKTSCIYEGTLWATLVLLSMDEDISAYVPYLVTSANDNPKTLPEAFLYMLFGEDYKNDFLVRQKSSQYWDTSGDKYYDTAVALLALMDDDVTEKTNSLDWLGDIQGKDGCWQTSIKNNAFLLYTMSSSTLFDGGGNGGGGNGNGSSTSDCETIGGGNCMSRLDCSSLAGSELDYSCSSTFNVCCDKGEPDRTCAEQGGEICSAGETCAGGLEVNAVDTYLTCCAEGGSCIKSTVVENDENNNGIDDDVECELNNGACRAIDCQSGESAASSLLCEFSSDLCCVSENIDDTGGDVPNPKPSYLWLWILIILIVLVILAIIFRDKLRRFGIYLKSKFKRSPPSGPMHSTPHFPSPMQRMIPRRILPPSGSASHHSPSPRKSGELDEVLKKLRDMSK